MALTAGDQWVTEGANLILIGPPGGGKSYLSAAIGLALVENGYRVLYCRTTDLAQKLQVARRELSLESAIAKLDKFYLVILDDFSYAALRHQRSGRDQRAVRIGQRPLRAPLAADHRQSAVRTVGLDFRRPRHDLGGRGSTGAPGHHLGAQRRQLSPAYGVGPQTGPCRPATRATPTTSKAAEPSDS